MGRILLVCRLAARDLGRRRGEAALLLLAIVAATTTLSLGLLLHGETSHPYEQTRAATAGPDVVASVFPAGTTENATPTQVGALDKLIDAPGVTGHSGPYPVTWAVIRARGITTGAEVEGRDQGPASVDRPKVTQGTWLRGDGVVIERTFAEALGVHAGDSITLNHRSFKVDGVAVTAAFTPYPQVCADGCVLNTAQLANTNPGLVWLSKSAARSLATPSEGLAYYLNLKLADPARADAFSDARNNFNSVTAPELSSWQSISQQDGNQVRNEQLIMLVGSWLLGLLAVASVAVLVGSRMADQIRRVGLLKAVGGTPGLVAAVFMAEYVFVALLAAAVGLVIGRLAAPLLTNPGGGYLGSAGSPPIVASTVEVVVGVALAVAVLAALIPAIRAARISTVRALADSPRQPRRRGRLIAISARLPVTLMLGLRLSARRPRRMVLSMLSIAITVSGIVAVMITQAGLSGRQVGGSPGLPNPRTQGADLVLLYVTVMLIALAAVNAVFITRAMVVDSRRTSALTRALGASPQQVTAGLSAAQVFPALAGALLGIPGGFGLYTAVKHGGSTFVPPVWWLIALVLGTVIVVAGLTALPARVGARRPVAEILQSELA
jgi:ABC-type antimicrobial peptide transport system permease subunit